MFSNFLDCLCTQRAIEFESLHQIGAGPVLLNKYIDISSEGVD
jgi:hypothetical protein